MNLAAYIDVEEALTRRLIADWRPMAAEAFAKVKEALAHNQFDKAKAAITELDLTKIAASNKEWVKFNLYATARFGAKVANPKGEPALTTATINNLCRRVYRTFELYMANTANPIVHEYGLQSIAAHEARVTKLLKMPDEVTAPDTSSFLDDFVSFADKGDRAIQLISSLHSNRLAAWGFTAEAEVLGITTYQLVATLDNRTSRFCRMINGRKFTVAEARDKLSEALSVTNPEDLRSVQPWPDQSKAAIAEYASMSSADLVEAGLHVPPFHPYCRTLLAKIGTRYRLARPDQTPEEAVQDITDSEDPVDPEDIIDQQDATTEGDDNQNEAVGFDDSTPLDTVVTADTFSEFGIDASEEQVAYWNAYVGVDPGMLFDMMAGADPIDIFEELVAAGVEIDEISGDMAVNIEGPLAGEGSDVAVNQIYSATDGTLYSNFAELEAADPDAAEAYIRQLYTGLYDTADTLGADSVVLNAEGTVADNATFGLLPSQDDWNAFRTIAADQIAIDGELSDIALGLDDEELQVVMDLLASGNPAAVLALAALPYEVDGVPLADLLFADAGFTMTLDLSNNEAVQRFKDYFGS